MNYLGSKTLNTERLILHKTEEKDLKILWEILLIREVSIYYLISRINTDWKKEKKWQMEKLKKASSPETFIWTIELKDTNQTIGQISFHPLEKENWMDIGWFISPEHQKKGYAYEAAQKAIKYMFLECNLEKIDTSVCKKNYNSYHLMDKLGFKRKKTTRMIKYTLLDHEEECYEYELSKKEYLEGMRYDGSI